MSKRRIKGEIVKREPGSGFTGSVEPKYLRIPDGPDFEFDTVKDKNGNWIKNPNGNASWCMLECEDSKTGLCKEFANIQVAFGEFKDEYLYHLSECELFDLTEEDKKEVEEKYGVRT